MAVVKMYITKFDREVLIDDKHPLAVAELDAARERLTTASHKLAEALYKAQSAAGTPPTDGDAAAAGTADQPKDEGVIDAEYVDTEK